MKMLLQEGTHLIDNEKVMKDQTKNIREEGNQIKMKKMFLIQILTNEWKKKMKLC
jgi:hypothetical protein